MSILISQYDAEAALLFAQAAELKLQGMDWPSVVANLGEKGKRLFELTSKYPELWKSQIAMVGEFVKAEVTIEAFTAMRTMLASKNPSQVQTAAAAIFRFRTLELKMIENRLRAQESLNLVLKKDEIRKNAFTEKLIAKGLAGLDAIDPKSENFAENERKIKSLLANYIGSNLTEKQPEAVAS